MTNAPKITFDWELYVTLCFPLIVILAFITGLISLYSGTKEVARTDAGSYVDSSLISGSLFSFSKTVVTTTKGKFIVLCSFSGHFNDSLEVIKLKSGMQRLSNKKTSCEIDGDV